MMKSLKFRLAAIFSLLMMLGFGLNLSIIQWGIPFIGVEGRTSRKMTEILKNMSLIADLKKERLARWLEERSDDIKVTAGSIQLSANYNSLVEIIKKRQAKGKLDTKDWKEISNKTSYRNLEKYFEKIIQVYKVYTRISIVAVESGLIQVSTDQDEIGEVELIESRVQRSLISGGVVISPVLLDSMSGKPIMQMYHLIKYKGSETLDNSSLWGFSILIFNISMNDIIRPMLHTGGDLGETGEIVLVNSNRRIIVNLKFLLTDGTLAEPLKHIIDAEPAKRAASGEEGIIESIDYRGAEVLAAYRHIVISNEFGWGMVVKKDKSEVFADLKSDNTRFLVTGVLLLIVLFMVIYYMTSLFFNPMNRLVKATEHVAKGNLDVKLPIMGGQELEQLSISFNHMIADLKSAREQSLHKEKEKLERVTSSAQCGLFLLDDKTKITYANRVAQEWFGDFEHLHGKFSWQLFDIDNPEEQCNALQAFKTGKSVRRDRDTRLINGETKTFDVTATPVSNARGEIINISMVLIDITERKRLEGSLLIEKIYLETLIKNAPEAIAVLDSKDKIKDINEEFTRLFGYILGEVKGKYINDLIIPPNLEDEANSYTKTVQSGKRIYAETKRMHKDGSIVDVSLLGAPILNKARVRIGTYGIYRDLTETHGFQRQLSNNEKRLDAILDTAINAIVVIDKKGIIESFNKAAAKIFGYSEEEVLGENVKILMPEPDKSKHDSYIENYHRTGVAKVIDTGREVVGQRKNKETFPMKLSLTHLILDTGVIYTGLIEDLTEYNLAELEKEELQERLKQSERMESLGLLAGGVAHDLNNIIGPIMAYPDLIRMDYAEGKPIDKDLDTIIHSAQRAADVIADLLALTRRGKYNMDSLNLNDLVNEYLSSAEYDATKRFHPEVSQLTHLSKNELLFSGSITHLYKVIMNLINNGCESMADGGVLSISTSHVSVTDGELSDKHIPAGSYQLLTIEDQGEGISEQNLSKIFDPFFTTKLKTGKSGTGLGLSVVYNVIKDHGAHIDVESSLGIGTKFSIYFPETTDKKETAKKDKQMIKGSGSVLVVDDRKEQRDIATRILTTLGYEVESVESGKEAISYLKKSKPDLIWLDMVFEDEMDGLDVYRKIIKTNPNQKTIIVSGYSESGRMSKAMELGVDGFIQKPYKIHEIGEKIQEVLDG